MEKSSTIRTTVGIAGAKVPGVLKDLGRITCLKKVRSSLGKTNVGRDLRSSQPMSPITPISMG